jgi:hypothetical protein
VLGGALVRGLPNGLGAASGFGFGLPKGFEAAGAGVAPKGLVCAVGGPANGFGLVG